MNTAGVGLAVTPAVLSTLFSHYVSRKRLRHQPTAQISYDEGLHLIRKFLEYASRHTVEDFQAFTAQWVPHPQWVKVDVVEIPQDELSRAASLLQEQLGPEGIRLVGGREWWQWRKPKTTLQAEWIEMKADYHERKKKADPGNRVMLYVHGGAYFFGSVDAHRYQIQRHARKLKARAIAPRYRLAPQFPFPCGLHDCLATYLYLLRYQEPKTIILAGDSAGGGMVLSMLVTLRDRGIPLPAGAILISPWADLTHSFPSVAGECPLDYIPVSGFHHKPSMAWPPPDEDELAELRKIAIGQKKDLGSADAGSDARSGIPDVGDVADTTTCLSVEIDGEFVQIKEQIQIYATNHLISHPLVSPVLQSTLGGLPPLLIMVGGEEILRDEQIYLAHKCANPEAYLPPDDTMDDAARELIGKYKPTDVHLQVWDGLCHVGPTLSFTSPAKYQYRAISQFGAWALAHAQKTEIDILDDDAISFISSRSSSSSSSSESERAEAGDPTNSAEAADKEKQKKESGGGGGRTDTKNLDYTKSIGKAGDPLPPFKDHMIRERVTTRGIVFPLPPAEELPGCTMDRNLIGVVKAGTVRKWLEHKKRWDTKFAKTKRRVLEERIREMKAGYEVFGEGEFPPPSALAGRRRISKPEPEGKKKVRSLGMSLWSLWGSKHDEMTVHREQQAEDDREAADTKGAEGQEADDTRNKQGKEKEKLSRPGFLKTKSRSHSHMKTVRDESQVQESSSGASSSKTGTGSKADEADERTTPMDDLLALRRKQNEDSDSAAQTRNLLSPNDIPTTPAPDTGVMGKRPFLDGISMPFSLGKRKNNEGDNASTMTLNSNLDLDRTGALTPRVLTPNPDIKVMDSMAGSAAKVGSTSTPLATPSLASPGERPELERFVTAQSTVVATPRAE
ncbi:monoterpene epsilon-lactone hydrolase [Rhypophila decipiens]